MVLDDLPGGDVEKWCLYLSLQRVLEIRSYKIVWIMGHKIHEAMADRDV